MIVNLLYRLNLWLDNNEVTKFILLILTVGMGTICISIRSIYALPLGIISVITIVTFTMIRICAHNGKLKHIMIITQY